MGGVRKGEEGVRKNYGCAYMAGEWGLEMSWMRMSTHSSGKVNVLAADSSLCNSTKSLAYPSPFRPNELIT